MAVLFTKDIKESLTFDDVYLLPGYSDLNSRKDADLTSEIVEGLKYKFPIISANMSTITEEDMALVMLDYGGTAAFHRFIDPEDLIPKLLKVCSEQKNNSNFGVSVGTDTNYIDDLFNKLLEHKFLFDCIFFIIDIAHGHSLKMKETIEYLKRKMESLDIPKIPIVGGNICTYEAARDLIKWGASTLKCGIGPGGACSTRVVAGVGCPQLSAITECKRAIKHSINSKVKLIADGGIRTSGDCVKALAAGADFLMIGSLLAGTNEAPGDVLTVADGTKVKTFSGMASINSQVKYFGKEASEITEEGISALVKYKGSADRKVLKKLKGGMEAGFSYCGCQNIIELHDYGSNPANWVKISVAGLQEGKPHVK